MNINRRQFVAGLSAFAAAGCTSFGGKRAAYELGMAGYTYRDYPTDAMLADLQKLGVHNLCVKTFHLPMRSTDAEVAAFKAKCLAHGVKPYGVGPVDGHDIAAFREGFEIAAKLGARVVVGVPSTPGATPVWTERIANKELCREISKLCDEYEINFAIHNHGPDMPACFPNAEAICEVVKNLSPRMGMCLDIGHEYRTFKDPVETIRKFGERIYDLHLKDLKTDETRKPYHPVPLGKGLLDLPAIVDALTEVGYAGSCSLEYEADFNDNFKPLSESVAYWNGRLKVES